MYTAGALIAKCEGCYIDILDKLATPYGLVRAGVAPDHQTTKNVSRAYDKIMENENVRFVGNLNFGTDISLQTIRDLYDVVILAIGTPKDKALGIPGEDKTGVFGAQTFVYWYNGHPEYRGAVPNLDAKNAIVIGNGNVALDVARVLFRSREEMQGSDLADHAGEMIFSSTLDTVHVVGRRGPENVQFSSKELGELGHMENAIPICDPAVIPDQFYSDDKKQDKVVNTNLGLLRGYSANKANGAKRSLHLDFLLTPIEIKGGDTVESVRFEKNQLIDGKPVGTGEMIDIPCDLLVTCIGYEMANFEELPIENGILKNIDGWVDDSLYVVGWAKRGPSGTIGTNRIDSQNVVDRILEDHCALPASTKTGGAGLDNYCVTNDVRTVSFEEWKKINQAEQERAADPSPRRKFVRTRDMLSVLN